MSLTPATVYYVTLSAVRVVRSANRRVRRLFVCRRYTQLGQWEMQSCMSSTTYDQAHVFEAIDYRVLNFW